MGATGEQRSDDDPAPKPQPGEKPDTGRSGGTEGGPVYRVVGDIVETLAREARERDAVHLAVLEGVSGRDERRPFVDLTAISELTYTATLETIYRPTRSALEAARSGSTDATADEPPIGMAVAYAGSDGRLEAPVARLHLSLFNRPGQLVLVVDPDRSAAGLYGRDREGRFRNLPFDYVNASDANRRDDGD